ncbi:outer membrane beta-barrel protein [candidate division KSB1 bacterium]|nr:outer membrane beta-barrel protein [candidate division KSB1 bacterium]
MYNKVKIPMLLLTILVLSASSAFSYTGNVLSLNAGYFNPKDTKGGMEFGVKLGKAVDEAVDIGLGLDVFHKSYSETSVVAKEVQNGLPIEKTTTSIKYSRTLLPLSLTVDVKLPAGRYFGYFLTGGLNYSFLFSNEHNYELDTKENRTFSGLGWQAGAGLYYFVGSRSTVLANIFYNGSEVSRGTNESIEGLPVTERVNMSGFGIRLGIKMDIR